MENLSFDVNADETPKAQAGEVNLTKDTDTDESGGADDALEYDDDGDEQEQDDTQDEQDDLTLDKLAKDSKTQSQIISSGLNFSQTQDYLAMAHAFTKTQSRHSTLLIAGNVIFASLFFTVLGIWSSYPKTKVVPVMAAEAICEVSPQTNPALNELAVSNFAQLAVLHSNSFSYADYNEKIEWAMSHYYTPEGRLKAVTAMRNFGVLKEIQENLFTMKATVNGTPSVSDIQEKDGSKVWQVKVPLMIEMFGATNKALNNRSVLATVTVKAATATRTNPTGLAVDDVRYLLQ